MSFFTTSQLRLVTLFLLVLWRPALSPAQSVPTPSWNLALTGGGAGRAQATGTASDVSGNVFVAGTFAGFNVAFGSFTLTNVPTPATSSSATQNGFLVKYSPGGAVLWARQASSPAFSNFVSVATDAAGNAYAVGMFSGGASVTFGSTVLTNAGSYRQSFVVKYDPQGAVLWAHSLGTSSPDPNYISSVAATAGGVVYVGGSFTGSLDPSGLPALSTTGVLDRDAFLVKYDTQGTPLWSRQLSGSGNDAGYAVVVDATGNPSLAGVFSSPTLVTGTTALANAGSSSSYSTDVFLVKYDAAGTAQWAQRAGGTGYDYCYGLTATATGNLYVAGVLDAAGGTAGGATIGAGATGALLAAYSPQGVGLWGLREGSGTAYNSVAPDANNNLVVSGFMQNTLTIGSQTLTSAGGFDLLSARYLANGTLIGAGREGGPANEISYGTCSDASNGQVVVGYTESYSVSPGNVALTSPGGLQDALVIRYAASGGVTFARRLGSGGGRNDVRAVAVDAQGNTYVIGTFRNNTRLGTVTLVGSGGISETFVAKYSPAGAVLWARQLSGPAVYSTGAALDATGNLYVTGEFLGALSANGSSLTLSSAGGSADYDVFLVKYDAQGTPLWARSAGGSGTDAATAIAVNAAGVVMMTGYFYSPTASFGTQSITGTATSAGASLENSFLARYDAAGTPQWARAFTSSTVASSRTESFAVAVDALGNSSISGDFRDNATFGSTNLSTAGVFGAFVAKCDPQGNVLWARQGQNTATNTFSYGQGIAFDPAGNVAITGGFSGPTAFGSTSLTLPPGTNSGVFITKYDAAGTVLWARQNGGTATTVGTALAADGAGNFYVGGTYYLSTATFGAFTLPAPFVRSAFVVRYDGAGTPQWAIAPTGGGNQSVRALATGPNGALSVVGTYTDYLLFGSGTTLAANEQGGTDFFLARLSGATALAQRAAVETTSAELYPNPAHDMAILRFVAPTTRPETLLVLDGQGRTVRQQPVPGQARQVSVNVAGLAAGWYVLRCGTLAQRLAVE